jgi:hypothetical protein
MAMTKTQTLQEVRIINASSEGPILLVTYEVTIDDPDDDQLPLTTKHRKSIPKLMENDDGEMVAVDISSEDPLVQTIAAAVWAD